MSNTQTLIEEFDLLFVTKCSDCDLIPDFKNGKQIKPALIKKWILKKLDQALKEQREDIRMEIGESLIIEINPSTDDQRSWHRGLGREEAQREMRYKILNLPSLRELKSCDCPTRHCPHYESDFDRFIKAPTSTADDTKE